MQIIKRYNSAIRECFRDFGLNVESLQLHSSHKCLYTHAVTEQKTRKNSCIILLKMIFRICYFTVSSLPSLISYQNEFDDNYPELNPKHCDFGRWMNSTTASYLLTTSHFKTIDKLHINLHDLAANVINYCKTKESRPATLIHLMQQIDSYSLEIGNEIAFLNEIEESAKDPLTHLLTRRLFNKIILNKLDISKATGREFSLMMCDLDHFKFINDTYGHGIGDKVLQHFSSLLEHILRKSDYIFRFGGEEFMILLPMTDKEEAVVLAQKVCDITASSELVIENISIRYTVSIGTIAIIMDKKTEIKQDTIDGYVTQVDEKLYLAKERGRNRVE